MTYELAVLATWIALALTIAFVIYEANAWRHRTPPTDEHVTAQHQPVGNAPTAWELYRFASENSRQTEHHRWSLLYNYLVASSVLSLAWATTYVASRDASSRFHPVDTMLLLVLSLAGLAMSFLWILVQHRAGCYVRDSIRIAKAAEKQVPGRRPYFLPYKSAGTLRQTSFDQLRILKLAGSGWFTKIVLAVFVAIHAAFLFASLALVL